MLEPTNFIHVDSPEPDWHEFYPDAKEELPPDMPKPYGEPVQVTTFCDSDHASDTVTRRSRTGVMVFCNKAPVVWVSRKQNSIETSTFGSEFTALKTAIELTEGIRYKLRMMGVPLDGDGAAHIMCDNQSVVTNSSVPQSVLKKKSNSIAFHYCREKSAQLCCKIKYEPTGTNVSDQLTKIQSGPVRQRLARMVLV